MNPLKAAALLAFLLQNANAHITHWRINDNETHSVVNINTFMAPLNHMDWQWEIKEKDMTEEFSRSQSLAEEGQCTTTTSTAVPSTRTRTNWHSTIPLPRKYEGRTEAMKTRTMDGRQVTKVVSKPEKTQFAF